MQDENPYQSPAEAGLIEPAARTDTFPASVWRRLANLLLDELGCVGLALVVYLPAMFLRMERVIDKIPDVLFGMLVSLLYYLPQEALWGKTLAKFVTGTRVVSATGGPPTFRQIVGRTFSRMIPFEALTYLRGRNPVGLHDSLSNTRVVMDR
jgi:uncharacterized RDD family membrane protein YckC